MKFQPQLKWKMLQFFSIEVTDAIDIVVDVFAIL